MDSLTEKQINDLVAIASDDPKLALRKCVEICEDNLVEKLLSRGGFATLQLSEDPNKIPRVKFVAPEKSKAVMRAKIGGILVIRSNNGLTTSEDECLAGMSSVTL